MADRKISALGSHSSPSGSDYIVINDTSASPVTTKRTTVDQLRTALNIPDGVGGGGTASNITNYYTSSSNPKADPAQNITAFNAALSATGGTVYFPAGEYNFGSNQMLLENAATVVGDGPKLVKLTFTGDNMTAIKVNHSTEDEGELRIRGMTINKTGAGGNHLVYTSAGDINTHAVLIEDVTLVGTSITGLLFHNGTFVTCRDVHIIPDSDTINTGIYFSDGPGPGDITSTNCLVTNCIFRNHGTGVAADGQTEGLSIVDCQMINMTNGIIFNPASGTGQPYFYVRGCHMDTRTGGIIARNVIQSKIVDNDIRRIGGLQWNGLVLSVGASGGSSNFANLIHGNTFTLSDLSNQAQTTGIYVDDARFIIIQSNIFHYVRNGINLDGDYASDAGTNFNIWLLDNMFLSGTDAYLGSLFTIHPYPRADAYVIRHPKRQLVSDPNYLSTASGFVAPVYGGDNPDSPNESYFLN